MHHAVDIIEFQYVLSSQLLSRLCAGWEQAVGLGQRGPVFSAASQRQRSNMAVSWSDIVGSEIEDHGESFDILKYLAMVVAVHPVGKNI